MWSALENAALRESLPAPIKSGESIHDILVAGQLRIGQYNLHHLGQRRSRRYLLKQFYSLNTDAFLRWQNEARFAAFGPQPGFNWPCEEWRGGVISPYPGSMTLAEWIETETRSTSQRILIATKLAQRCAQLHDIGIAHRRLTPYCIRISENDVIITDFGSAHHEAWDDFWSDTIMTPGDMTCASPESLRGETCGYAEDVYALGSMLFFLLSGHLPFGAIKRSLRPLFPGFISPNGLPEAADIPKQVRELTTACLSPNPSERPLMKEVAKRLAQTAGANPQKREGVSLPSTNESLAGKDKVMVFIKDDRHAISLFDAVLATAKTKPSAFLFVGLIPNNLPSGHTERFKGRVFRKLGQGLLRCREAGILWSLRVFENVDPEQAALELVKQYRPDRAYIGNSAQRKYGFRQNFQQVLGGEIPIEPIS